MDRRHGEDVRGKRACDDVGEDHADAAGALDLRRLLGGRVETHVAQDDLPCDDGRIERAGDAATGLLGISEGRLEVAASLSGALASAGPCPDPL